MKATAMSICSRLEHPGSRGADQGRSRVGDPDRDSTLGTETHFPNLESTRNGSQGLGMPHPVRQDEAGFRAGFDQPAPLGNRERPNQAQPGKSGWDIRGLISLLRRTGLDP